MKTKWQTFWIEQTFTNAANTKCVVAEWLGPRTLNQRVVGSNPGEGTARYLWAGYLKSTARVARISRITCGMAATVGDVMDDVTCKSSMPSVHSYVHERPQVQKGSVIPFRQWQFFQPRNTNTLSYSASLLPASKTWRLGTTQHDLIPFTLLHFTGTWMKWLLRLYRTFSTQVVPLDSVKYSAFWHLLLK
jgi:hypothetical protein